jgi:glutamate synthase domain-containing protein 1
MCIIVVQPIGKNISRKTLETCFCNNPDGAGYMFTRDKKLVIKKGYFTFDSFYHNYKIDWIENGGVSPFVLHFRIATHGNIDRLNCHPHRLKENLAFVHNGIFSSVKAIRAKESKSDTLQAAIIFKQLPDNWFYCKSMKILVGDFFKANNSYGAFMDNTGQLFMTDKNSWTKKNKILYSNDSFEDKVWNFMPHTKKDDQHTGPYTADYGDYYDNVYDNYGCFRCSTPD